MTTLYFESVNEDELRNFGFIKGCKFKETQVLLALVTTSEGLAVTHCLFPGNIYEGHTWISMMAETKKVHEVGNIEVVADRAMFSKENLDMMEAEGVTYIVASRPRQLPRELKGRSLNLMISSFQWLMTNSNLPK